MNYVNKFKIYFNKDKLIKLFNSKTFFFLFIGILATYIFFQFKIIFFTDSYYYYFLANCLKDVSQFKYWLPVRGFSYPLILVICTKLFGESQLGLSIGAYIIYMSFNILFLILLNKFLNINNVKRKKIFYILYALMIVFNPMITGFTHSIMTEAIIPLLYLIAVAISLKWYKVGLDIKRNIIYNIIFVLFGIFIWFLKQPYIIVYLAILFITSCASATNLKDWKIFFSKILTIVLTIFFIIISVMIWDTILKNNNIEKSANTNQTFMNSSVYSGTNTYFYSVQKNVYCDKDYILNLNISEKDKNKAKKVMETDPENWCDHIVLYAFTVNNEVLGHEILISQDNKISMFENLGLLIKTFKDYPRYTIMSYVHNYLALIDIEQNIMWDGHGFRSSGKIKHDAAAEIPYMSLYELYSKNAPTLEYLKGEKAQGFEVLFEDYTNDHGAISEILLLNHTFIFFTFKILMLCAIPIFIYSAFKFIRNKNISYFMICLISGATSINNLFFTCTGSIIDRYAYPMFPLMILCFFLLCMEKKVEKILK